MLHLVHPPSAHAFSIISINIRSLPAHTRDLLSDPNFLQAGIMHICETRTAQPPLMLHDLLQLPSAFIPVGDGSPGSALFVHPTLHPFLRPDLNRAVHLAHVDILTAVLHDIALIFVYRSPARPLHSAITSIEEAVSAASHITPRVFLMGDFNVNLLCDDARSASWLQRMQSIGMQQLLRVQPTHDNGAMLDHIWASPAAAHVSRACGVLDVIWSDHKAVVCDVHM